MSLMLFLVMFLTVTASVEARQQQGGGSPVINTNTRTFRAPTNDEVTFPDSILVKKINSFICLASFCSFFHAVDVTNFILMWMTTQSFCFKGLQLFLFNLNVTLLVKMKTFWDPTDNEMS